MRRVGEALKSFTRVHGNDYNSYDPPTHQPDVSPSPISRVSNDRTSPGNQENTGTMSGMDAYDSYEEASVAGSAQSPTRPPSPAPGILVNGGQGTGNSSQISQNSQRTTSWRIHRRAPTLMVSLFVVGIALALGHHFYYQSLDGTVVSSDTRQEWALRFGTAFAFLTHSSLVSSAGAAYAQRLWVTVKRKSFRLETLDNIFSLQGNLFSFLSWDVLSKAKALCLLGLCIWCIPIASVITPATLSVRPGIITDIRTANVPNPDYSYDMATNWANFEGAGYPDGPTPEVSRVLAATLTSMAVLPFTAPFPNSSYSLDFYGPSFRCENMSTAVADNALNINQTTLQESWDLTMDNKTGTWGALYIGASPNWEAPINFHLFVNTNGFSETGSNYSCHMWNTSYTARFNFIDGVQSAEIEKSEQLSPLDHVVDRLDTYGPGEMQYWVTYKALVDALTAEVRWGSTGSLMGDDSDIVKSALAACPDIKGYGREKFWFDSVLCRAGSIPGAIEDLSRNLTLSILSSPLLANETAAEVTVHTPATFYSYNWRNLLLAYAITICATAACVAVGMQSLVTNGYSAGTSFSSILLTTRNTDLDELARGYCLGESPLAKDVGDRRLKYGLLESQTHNADIKGSHAGFGLADSVREIKRGDPCW